MDNPTVLVCEYMQIEKYTCLQYTDKKKKKLGRTPRIRVSLDFRCYHGPVCVAGGWCCCRGTQNIRHNSSIARAQHQMKLAALPSYFVLRKTANGNDMCRSEEEEGLKMPSKHNKQKKHTLESKNITVQYR